MDLYAIHDTTRCTTSLRWGWAAAARLHRLHHEVPELLDCVIVALASVVLHGACKTHIYPVYFWV